MSGLFTNRNSSIQTVIDNLNVCKKVLDQTSCRSDIGVIQRVEASVQELFRDNSSVGINQLKEIKTKLEEIHKDCYSKLNIWNKVKYFFLSKQGTKALNQAIDKASTAYYDVISKEGDDKGIFSKFSLSKSKDLVPIKKKGDLDYEQSIKKDSNSNLIKEGEDIPSRGVFSSISDFVSSRFFSSQGLLKKETPNEAPQVLYRKSSDNEAQIILTVQDLLSNDSKNSESPINRAFIAMDFIEILCDQSSKNYCNLAVCERLLELGALETALDRFPLIVGEEAGTAPFELEESKIRYEGLKKAIDDQLEESLMGLGPIPPTSIKGFIESFRVVSRMLDADRRKEGVDRLNDWIEEFLVEAIGKDGCDEALKKLGELGSESLVDVRSFPRFAAALLIKNDEQRVELQSPNLIKKVLDLHTKLFGKSGLLLGINNIAIRIIDGENPKKSLALQVAQEMKNEEWKGLLIDAINPAEGLSKRTKALETRIEQSAGDVSKVVEFLKAENNSNYTKDLCFEAAEIYAKENLFDNVFRVLGVLFDSSLETPEVQLPPVIFEKMREYLRGLIQEGSLDKAIELVQKFPEGSEIKLFIEEAFAKSPGGASLQEIDFSLSKEARESAIDRRIASFLSKGQIPNALEYILALSDGVAPRRLEEMAEAVKKAFKVIDLLFDPSSQNPKVEFPPVIFEKMREYFKAFLQEGKLDDAITQTQSLLRLISFKDAWNLDEKTIGWFLNNKASLAAQLAAVLVEAESFYKRDLVDGIPKIFKSLLDLDQVDSSDKLHQDNTLKEEFKKSAGRQLAERVPLNSEGRILLGRERNPSEVRSSEDMFSQDSPRTDDEASSVDSLEEPPLNMFINEETEKSLEQASKDLLKSGKVKETLEVVDSVIKNGMTKLEFFYKEEWIEEMALELAVKGFRKQFDELVALTGKEIGELGLSHIYLSLVSMEGLEDYALEIKNKINPRILTSLEVSPMFRLASTLCKFTEEDIKDLTSSVNSESLSKALLFYALRGNQDQFTKMLALVDTFSNQEEKDLILENISQSFREFAGVESYRRQLHRLISPAKQKESLDLLYKELDALSEGEFPYN